jgi:hypothetical protein
MNGMSVDVKAHLGKLPPFWNRNALFFANLLSLFFGNTLQTRSLKKEVGRIESYGGRLAPIMNILFKGGNNLLVLDRKPDEDLVAYFEKGLGLSLPEVAVLPFDRYITFPARVEAGIDGLPADFRTIAEHPAEWVDGFVTDECIVDIARSLGKATLSELEGSRRGNNKVLLHEFLVSDGLPSFDTQIATSPDDLDACVAAIRDQGYSRAVIKAQVGASGVGMIKIDTVSRPASVPDYFFYEGPCLVQGWLQVGEGGVQRLYSPSVQMFIHDDAVYLYDVTEQILSDESVHQGNHAPPPYLEQSPDVKQTLVDQSRRVGSWLHQQEYRGTASIDYVVVGRNDAIEIFVCEINARITGATYPSILARNFVPGGSWIMRNLALASPLQGKRILEEIDRAGYLYRCGKAQGILPINFNSDENRLVDKGQFLFIADNSGGCAEMMDEIEETLPIHWSHDRD